MIKLSNNCRFFGLLVLKASLACYITFPTKSVASMETSPTSEIQEELQAAKTVTPVINTVTGTSPISQLPNSTTIPSNRVLDQIEQYTGDSSDIESDADPMNQVTSVSQLKDVQVTDWAFQALQYLVERYGCIAGYPGGTYGGNRAMNRYEFAAGLNSCLDRISQQITTATANLANQDDLTKIRRLQAEFAPELAALGGRVDTLETRTTQLEANQFSPSTKLTGEVEFSLIKYFAGNNIIDQNNEQQVNFNQEPVLQYTSRLDFQTSFTGKDLLRVRLSGNNSSSFTRTRSLQPPPPKPSQQFIDELIAQRDYLVEIQDELRSQSSDPEYGDDSSLQADIDYLQTEIDALNTQISAAQGNQGSAQRSRQPQRTKPVSVPLIDYRFLLGKNMQVNLFATGGEHAVYADKITEGSNNPLYRIGGAGSGIGLNYKLSEQLSLNVGYIAAQARDLKEGLFNGSYSALAQLVIEPSKQFKLGLVYANTYNPTGKLDLAPGGLYFSDSDSNSSDTSPITSNSYGIAASYRVSPQFSIGGWLSYTSAHLTDFDIDGDLWNYGITLALRDLGKKGNQANLTVAVDPTLRGLTFENSAIEIPQRDYALWVSASYRYKLTNRIEITPQLTWRPSYAQDFNNDDIFTATLRTKFSF